MALQSEDQPKARYILVARSIGRTVGKNYAGALGLVLVVGCVVSIVFGPMLIDIDPNRSDLIHRLLPFGGEYEDGRRAWLGTDALGRDQLIRVLVGGRSSLVVVLMGMLLAGCLGSIVGMFAGFYGGRIDQVAMRLVDAQLALPTLVLALLIAATLGVGLRNTAITLGIATWPIYARIVRAEVLKIREEDYIEAAVALGGRDTRLLGRHVIPNISSSLLVVGSLELGHLLLVESSLSFLGFGMQPPDASWGAMVRQGQPYLQSAWWLSAVPGVFISLTVLGLNLLGDWLRDIFDPHVT